MENAGKIAEQNDRIEEFEFYKRFADIASKFVSESKAKMFVQMLISIAYL